MVLNIVSAIKNSSIITSTEICRTSIGYRMKYANYADTGREESYANSFRFSHAEMLIRALDKVLIILQCSLIKTITVLLNE